MNERVKLIAAIIYADENDLKNAISSAELKFSAIDYISPPFPFNITEYYKKEMGENLQRRIISFAKTIDASQIAEIKKTSIALENKLCDGQHKRTVNIDTGYIDYDKMVLASTKRGPHKLYISDGIWADMTMHYEKGHFFPTPWSFADFKDGRYEKVLLRIRELYKKQRNEKTMATPSCAGKTILRQEIKQKATQQQDGSTALPLFPL